METAEARKKVKSSTSSPRKVVAECLNKCFFVSIHYNFKPNL